MTIRFKCVECNSVMKIKDEKAGTTGHCPKCKKEFIVPQPSVEESSVEEPVAAAAEGKKSRKVADAPKEKTSDPVIEQTEESMEDEFQRILMGGDSPKDASHKKGADSDTYLTGDSSDEHPDALNSNSATKMEHVPEPPPKARPRTTAEMADALINNTAEPTLKKTGKAFGEGRGDKEDVRKKAAAEARMYYIKRIGLGAIGVPLVCFGLYYMMSSMMGSGTKYPPLGRVTGKVTLDGVPVPSAMVSFQPMAEGPKADTKIAGSAGVTDKEGHYELFYVEGVRGAVVGKHSVQIRALSDVGVEMIPGKYNSNTTLISEVKPGTNPPIDFPLMK
jgi:DNA-directed RNA polymerase subunit M/transcription elongation factor TFIIS